MILRVWRAQIVPARIEEYRRFERERCLSMLRRQPGFLGVLFLRQAEDRVASLTIWENIGALPFKRAAGVEFRGSLADRAWLT